MARAVRWQFALPWLIVLIAVLVVAQIVLARLVRTSVNQAGEESVGAKVDVGTTRVSLLGRKVSLREIAVANPQAALRNLVEVDACELHFEAVPLLQKRAVVDHGTLSGIRFGTERSTSGLLPGATEGVAGNAGWLDAAAAAKAEAWLEKLQATFAGDLVAELQSIRLTEELIAGWPERQASLEERAGKLHERIAEFQANVRKAKTNPLRNVEFLEKMPSEVARLRDDLAELGDKVQNLPQIADEQGRAIVAARQHDEEILRERLRFERIDGNALTAYLLQQQLAGPVADLVGWVRWMRRAMPAETGEKKIARGEEVLFAGCQAAPDLLIRTLELRGTAYFAGRPLDILGVVTDYANAPRLHDQPLRVRLATSGALPLELQATIDRTGPVARDQLLVDCGTLTLPKLTLGGSDKLRLSLAPTTAALHVVISLEGEQLSGDIQFVQPEVQVSPETTGELAEAGVDDALADSLAGIKSITTRVSLAGTLAEPRCQVASNFGTAVSDALEQALAGVAEAHGRRLLAKSQQRVDEQLAQLDRQIGEQQAALSPQISNSSSTVAGLGENNERPVRVTLEHLGRNLPADSLFR